MTIDIPEQTIADEAPSISMNRVSRLMAEVQILTTEVDGKTMEDWTKVHLSHRITSPYATLDRIETLLLRAQAEVREQRDLALDWDPV